MEVFGKKLLSPGCALNRECRLLLSPALITHVISLLLQPAA